MVRNIVFSVFSLSLFSLACAEKEVVEERGWESADLKELSSGECPDMSESGATVQFLSSDEERTVTILFPSNPEPKMRIVYFFHGLMDPSYSPSSYIAQALNFQELADEYNALIILPESPIWNLMGQRFYMWDVEEGTTEKDLTLFDDLRTCAARNFDVDLDQLVSSGFSGGSLFNTILLGERADHIATIVEMSGGANIEVPTFEKKFARYKTPVVDIPVLLISGGANDLWPDASYPIVQFEEATNTLQSKLLEDDQFVVRCTHNTGHNITNKAFSVAIDWLNAHEYGVSSPYEAGIGDWEDWCVIPE